MVEVLVASRDISSSGDVGVSSRQRLGQLCWEDISLLWRKLPDSDPVGHLGCGYIPTGRGCPSCDRILGGALPEGYSYQEDALRDDHLTVMATGGEQAGKTNWASMKGFQVICAFIGAYGESGRAAGEVAWLVGSAYEFTAQEFQNLRDWLLCTPFKVDPSKRVDPGEILIRVKGGHFTIKTRSANDEQSLRAESPVVAVVCEAALLTSTAYERLISRVARARSMFPGFGAIIMSGTLEGSLGWYPTFLEKWKSPAVQESENVASFSLPSPSNVFAFPGGFDNPVIKELEGNLSPTAFRERVLAVPAPPSGRVHQTFDPTVHIQPTKYDASLPVYLAIDPGYSGRSSTYAVEVVQPRPRPCHGNHFWVIDEIFEVRHHPTEIARMVMQRYWWKNEMKTAVVDISAEGHKDGMESTVEVWYKTTGLVLMNQKVNILPGIGRFDSMLSICPECQEPYLVFDSRKCQGVISELGGGTNPFDGQVHVYSWQKDRQGNVVGGNPVDEYCDGIKAITYLFVNQFGYAEARQMRSKVGRVKRHRIDGW
jgi:hypothetical protein